MVASVAEMMMPTAGTPRADSLPNAGGNSLSSAAAIGTCPISSVQPLSAPIEEMITAIATAPAPTEPHMIRAASVNGATDLTSCSYGTTPITTRVPST
ncbi:MAG: hypothetical protein HONDAALG_01055 [Gammaproteobacteria bacterium]|nr:hypothetical protein [Gammaproteobacteria bacterium]